MKKILISLLLCAAALAQPKTIEQRIDSILVLMTLDEKIGQLNQYSGGFYTGASSNRKTGSYEDLVRQGKLGSLLNVFGAERTKKYQRIAVKESRLKIPLVFGLDVIHGFRTTFPVPIAEASTWNPALVEQSARWQAVEASAGGIHWTFGPMVDIARDPRWGRIVEGSGEDPYLGSLMAAARVRGYQGNDLASTTSIMACAKHYAGYGAAEGGRDYNTADFSERTLRETYLPPFKAAVDAGAGSLMASFNEIGGVPSSASTHLLTDILRTEWRFDGMVVSDWNSIGELIPHGVAKDLSKAAQLAITAGVDMDMESDAYSSSLRTLVERGVVPMNVLDESVRRVLRMKFRLGLFENPYKSCDVQREKNSTKSKAIIDASRDVAQKSIVLLKNEHNLLPLANDARRIAVIGPLADSHFDPLGPWNGLGDTVDVVSVLDGIKNAVGRNDRIIYRLGCSIDGRSTEGIDDAVAAVNDADVAIVVLGESLKMSGEARSRSTLDLPGVQEELIERIMKTGKPVVVVLMNGRPLAVRWIAENVPAVIEAWFLGGQSGNAIADVLFGDYNPSGKLPVTFPRSVGQVPLYYNHKNTGRPHNPKDWYTSYYLDADNTPLYPFGYGLSYSKFSYSQLSIDSKKMPVNGSLKVGVDVKNDGTRKGEEVVQLYVRQLVGSVTRPVKELKDFTRISLVPGETKHVEFTVTSDKLKYLNLQMKPVVEPGEYKVFVGTNSVDVLETSFEVAE